MGEGGNEYLSLNKSGQDMRRVPYIDLVWLPTGIRPKMKMIHRS